MIAKKAPSAVHVLDRFRIAKNMNEAIDEVRATEAKALTRSGKEPVLKGSRWLLQKRPENLTDGQEVRLAELVQYNLRAVRAYLLKEDFDFFWRYVSPKLGTPLQTRRSAPDAPLREVPEAPSGRSIASSSGLAEVAEDLVELIEQLPFPVVAAALDEREPCPRQLDLGLVGLEDQCADVVPVLGSVAVIPREHLQRDEMPGPRDSDG